MDGPPGALDRASGKVVWDIEVGDPTAGYSLTAAPLVLGNNVIVGCPVASTASGAIWFAYDAVSGKEAWRWLLDPGAKGDPTFDAVAPNGWVRHLDQDHARWR